MGLKDYIDPTSAVINKVLSKMGEDSEMDKSIQDDMGLTPAGADAYEQGDGGAKPKGLVEGVVRRLPGQSQLEANREAAIAMKGVNANLEDDSNSNNLRLAELEERLANGKKVAKLEHAELENMQLSLKK